jgi:ABC-2 type transport system permease protein
MFNLFTSNLKMMVRGRQALFWALAFPIMFTVIFGFFFGGGNTSAGTIAMIDRAKTELSQSYVSALKDSNTLTVKEDYSEAEARGLLAKGQIGAIVMIPENFGNLTVANSPKAMTIINDPANSQVNSVIFGYTNQFLTRTDYAIYNIKPTFSITEEKTNQRTLNYFDFVLMGLIGLALMNASIQGIAITMANYREDKILKRITTTPLKPWKFIVAEVLSRIILNILQIAVILGIGYYGFHAHIYGSVWLIFAFAILGGLLFQSIGFLIASVARSTDASQGMSVAISIPMMFLAGVFFPIDSLPRWLYAIVQYLPLAPLLRMIRTIGLEAGSPFADPKNIIIVLGWIVVCLFVSVWRFRLSEE